MRLTVFGNNATWPAPRGACSCYLLETVNEAILLDMGSAALTRLQIGFDLTKLSLIAISHLHYDHIGDLFCAKYQLEARRANGEDIRPIPVLSPELPPLLRSQLADGGVFKLVKAFDGLAYITPGNTRITYSLVQHVGESYGMRITTGEDNSSGDGDNSRGYSEGNSCGGDNAYSECSSGVFAYSGDSGLCDSLFDIARDAELFLCEAGAPEGGPAAAHHLTASQALMIAHKARAKQTLLTHFYPKDRKLLQRVIDRSGPDAKQRCQLCTIGKCYSK